MTSIAAGGATKWQGTTSKALKSATVNSNAATLNTTQSFVGDATLANGTNSVPVAVTDGSNTAKTSNFQVSSNGSAGATPIYDSNGNMTSDGTNSYAWDAESRLAKIVYPGTNNYTTLAYGPFGERTKIVELVNGSITNTKQFIAGEERDSSGTVVKQFFGLGVVISSTSYFFVSDNLGSVREILDQSGNKQCQYSYDLYGRKVTAIETVPSDIQYAKYYFHARSGLSLTATRPYATDLGIFLSRDPIGEQGGLNLYGYSSNPASNVDREGTDWVSAAEFDQKTGIDGGGAAISRVGCRGSVTSALGIPSFALPETYPDADHRRPTKCWFGSGSFVRDAADRASRAAECDKECPPPNKKVIWCKQGIHNEPGAPGSSVPSGQIGNWTNSAANHRGEAYNYSLYVPGSGFAGGFPPGSNFPEGHPGYFGAPDPIGGNEYPNSMCCYTCVKSK